MKLLDLYQEEVKKFVVRNNGVLEIQIPLTSRFLVHCKQRIVEGSVKYGDDWQYKDCLNEKKYEEFDIFNYLVLHECQKKYKKTLGGRK